MALRTYGDKPLSFQLEENGEFFYVGSEVCIVFSCIHRIDESKNELLFHRSETIYECFVVRCTKSTQEWFGKP